MSCTTTTSCTTTRGPAGPTGPQGPQGAKGDKGDTGTAGKATLKYITVDQDYDYSAETTSLNIVIDVAMGGAARKIKLPEPTTTNAGNVVKIILASNLDNTAITTIGFNNAGTAVMKGGLLCSQTGTDTEQVLHMSTSTAQSIKLQYNVNNQGGAKGTEITLTYLTTNIVAVSGVLAFNAGTFVAATAPGLTLSTTGWV